MYVTWVDSFTALRLQFELESTVVISLLLTGTSPHLVKSRWADWPPSRVNLCKSRMVTSCGQDFCNLDNDVATPNTHLRRRNLIVCITVDVFVSLIVGSCHSTSIFLGHDLRIRTLWKLCGLRRIRQHLFNLQPENPWGECTCEPRACWTYRLVLLLRKIRPQTATSCNTSLPAEHFLCKYLDD